MNGFTTETLLSLLSCLNVDEKELAANLNDKIFKTANVELFRKIVCFVLSKFGDFDKFIAPYQFSYALSPKAEAQFRNSLKEAVSTINGLYPDKYNLKPINQSYLVAPQGQKIVDFLVRLINVTILIIYERSGVAYVPPQTVEECGSSVTDFELLENTDQQKEETEIEQKRLESNSVNRECLGYVKRFFLPPDLENILDIKNNKLDLDKPNSVALVEICHILSHRLECKQLSVLNSKRLLNSLVSFKSNYQALEHKPKNLSLDGLIILNKLRFKSNISAKIDNTELIKDGKLDLNSLFKVAFSKHKMLSEYVNRQGYKIFDDINSYLNEKLLLGSISYDKEQESVRQFIDKIKPVTSIKKVKMMELIQQSQDPFHVAIREYLDRDVSFSSKQELAKERAPIQIKLPVADKDLVQWILGDETDDSNLDPLNKTGKLSSKQVKYLSLSAKKLPSFKSELKKKFDVEEKNKPFMIKTALLKGIGDRRATLASPSARRERFKVKHFDDKRKPLKPMMSKALFCSSSPLNHNSSTDKVAIDNIFKVEENVEFVGSSTTVDKSALKTDGELNDSVTSLAFGCCFSLNRTLSEPSLNLTQEMLKFENTLSDSDLDSPNKPVRILKTETESPKLNNSVEQLILRYQSYKEKLNLSE